VQAAARAPGCGLLQASWSGPGACPHLVAELDFDDAESLKTALKSPEMAAVAADAATLDAERVMFTGEVVSR
jgi:ribonuclease I